MTHDSVTIIIVLKNIFNEYRINILVAWLEGQIKEILIQTQTHTNKYI